MTRIVVVGGGAAGLELVTRLSRKFRKKPVEIILIDCYSTHLWKPLLHEAAAGTLDTNQDEINYFAFASTHQFKFILGSMIGLDRASKKVRLAFPELNIEEREIAYDILIIAIGSVANDFGVKGVREYCEFIDNYEQAEAFHKIFLNQLLQLSTRETTEIFNIGIVGGGATGIELAAELHYAVEMISQYGVDVDVKRIQFSLIEAAASLIPALPERISKAILTQLVNLNVKVYLNTCVTEVMANGFMTTSGTLIPADLKIWTAGVKAPDFLSSIGLPTNRNHQLIVNQSLQTEDPAIFAIGDCAACVMMPSNLPVPPRAQAAHQEAIFMVKVLTNYLNQQPLPIFHYHDYGSLISLSHYNVIGSLMGRITQSFKIEGLIARFFYRSLYKKHLTTLYGPWKVALMSLANLLNRRVKPRVKLH